MNKRIAQKLVGSLAVLAVLAITPAAHAEDKMLATLPKVRNPEAHAHIVSGNAHYRTKEFELALDEYKKGLQQEDAAIFLYNIGQCHRFLRRWDDALWVFHRFLDRKPAPALVERVEGIIKDIEEKQAADKALAKNREPTDAASVGDLPSRQAAPTSQPVAAPGVTPIKPTMRIVAGEPWYRDSLGWTETGLGVIGLGIGAWLLADVSTLNDKAHDTTSFEERASLYDRASTRRTAAMIAGGVGVVATVVGIATLIRHPDDHEEPVRTSWHLGIVGHGFAVSGRF